MRHIQIPIVIIILSLTACTTIASKGRIEKFGRISEAYEFALLDSDYGGAAKFIHTSIRNSSAEIDDYKIIKIVEYKITHMDVSEDELSIKQDIELQYFRLNNNRLRTTNHQQIWRYDEAEKVWQLHTALPSLP